ncbi:MULTISPECIES: hypothetical protein [unclassified Streptomyces]|uniref:hypothetical protein n=1 Tax=unclassified Streptomyces TaxID=2593676 RepID=UPI0020244337|nr:MULTISPECIES: hypothetical protein [unclassified Streptomyces]MCX4550617.1 hypothetical protein [Streptomyces sp. NBC_01500]WSC22062.1 hypothetical protein OIE60_21540 [Streptomyces sp. NBC_01766]
MALEWYLALGGTEIANHARLDTYLGTVGSPLDSSTVCGCQTFDAVLVGDEPYTTPDDPASPAPWYDPAVPESAEFCGLLVLDVGGLDDHPVQRQVTAAVTGGAALGPARTQARTVTVTGVLLGATCCGVDYGLRWLAQALGGTTGAQCGGDCLELYNCCPAQFEDPGEFAEQHRRTVRRVALVSAPTVTARAGNGCSGTGGCSVGADMLTVEFVLSAATPWMWTDPVTVIDQVPVPTDDGTECITWCVHGGPPDPSVPICIELADTCPDGEVGVPFGDSCATGWPATEGTGPCSGGCRLAACPDMDDLCRDPNCRTPAPPVPPPPGTCFCHALAVNTAAYELDLTSFPAWFGLAPQIEVYSGSGELRNLTVTVVERPDGTDESVSCEDIASAGRCDAAMVVEVGYVAAGATLTVDGQIGRALVDCAGECETASDVYGRDGTPLEVPLLRARRYCVLLEADAITTPATDATLSLAVSGQER